LIGLHVLKSGVYWSPGYYLRPGIYLNVGLSQLYYWFYVNVKLLILFTAESSCVYNEVGYSSTGVLQNVAYLEKQQRIWY